MCAGSAEAPRVATPIACRAASPAHPARPSVPRPPSPRSLLLPPALMPKAPPASPLPMAADREGPGPAGREADLAAVRGI